MASSVEWQNTGTFGPEQADLDVAYATSLPPDASLEWVEARLAEIQSHLANLGGGRNLLIPIYQLPRVVLFQILSWVALSYPSPKSDKDPYRYPLDQTKHLLHASQACKLFREAALERPELWVRINLKYPGLSKLFLERSADKLVTVYLYPPRSETNSSRRSRIPLEASTLEILRPHLSRITDVDLTFTMPTGQGYGGNPLAMHMPALRTLQLRNVGKEEENAESSSDSTAPEVPPPPVLPTANGPYPHLRKVVILAINVPWDSSIFSGLTELDMSSQASEHAPNAEEFLKALAQCPGLEKLHLSSSGPKEQPNIPTPDITKKVQLSHLRDLSIVQHQGRYMDIPLLLAGVSIPPSTKIHIQCSEAVEPVIRFSQMFPPEHPFLAKLPKYGTFKHLHSFTFFHFRLIDDTTGGSLSFRVNRHNQTVKTAASILDFFKTFGESARHAEIYPGAEGNPWKEVLKTLPNVGSLKMRRELDHADFVAGLSTKVCPKLKKLTFEYYSHTAEHQTQWLAGVKARAANGMKLEEFSLTFAQGEELLTAEVVEEFKANVGKFSRQKL